MAEFTLPLAGPLTQRNIDPINYASKDQRFIGCLFTTAENSLARERNVWVNKRPGFKDPSITIVSNRIGIAICDQSSFRNTGGGTLSQNPCTAFYTAVVGTNFYVGTTFIGSVTDTVGTHISALTTSGGNNIYAIVLDNAGAYYIGDTGMAGAGVTFTADTTNSAATLTSVSSFTGLVVGQKLSGTGIAATARIAVLDSGASKITMSANATATNSTVTITRERMSKIIDADFPTPIGYMVYLNGYFFISSALTKRIYQSAVDNIASWAASDYLTVDATPGTLMGIAKTVDRIVAVKTDCIESYYNAGNPSGSILSVDTGARKLTLNNGYDSSVTPEFSPVGFVDDYVFSCSDKIYLTVGNQTKPISTNVIDAIIANSLISTYMLNAFKMHGKIYLHFFQTGASFSYLYDVDLGIWSESGFGANLPIISQSFGYAIYAKSDGKLHYYPWIGIGQTPVYQDDGVSYTMTVQTNRTDFGYNGWKFIKEIHLLADNQASGTATLERSVDDGATWATIGTFDMTSQRKRIMRGGAYEGQAQYRLTHSANTPFRASALKFIYDGRGG